jgi:hypothetical protein
MKKSINKILLWLGYVPKPRIPVFEYNVYQVYQDRIADLKNQVDLYKNMAADELGQLPELLMLAHARIDSLTKENKRLYLRLKENNLLWNDDTLPYVVPYDEEFFNQLNQDTTCKLSTVKKSRKSNKHVS